MRTTESSVSLIKEQMWHLGSVQSEGKLALPARCCRLTWYHLTVPKKDVTRGLAENLPLHSLVMAWTQGLLSVKTQARCLNDEWAEVFYGGCNTQSFDFAR